MRKTTFTLASAAALFVLAACGGKDDTYTDTATVPGIDTTAGFAIPTADPFTADSIRRADSIRLDSLADTTVTP
ncbi:MAG: hypothetical protein WD801_02365 [Gemmatimonadaceae bacterium]